MIEMSPDKLTAETTLELFRHLPSREQERFRKLLERETALPALAERGGRRVSPPIPPIDRSRELQWLQDHAAEYANQWVALHNGELLLSGATAKEVFAAAAAAGIERPFVVQVEDPGGLPFAGW
jgi:hypothetical protein